MNNLFVFHGADHKVGTTMLAQSVAEMIAGGNKNANVLLVSLNGRKSTEYVREDVWSIDHFRAQIESGMKIDRELLTISKGQPNLYLLAGIENELEERFYLPETALRLLEGLAEQFDLIVADTGSELDNGLALGGLAQAKKRFLVLSQNESSIKRYEKTSGLYGKLQITFDYYVINKYCLKDPYEVGYLTNRLDLQKCQLLKVEMMPYGKQAEMEYKTILEYGAGKYMEDILLISNQIVLEAGMEPIKLQRKNKWKNFI